MLFRSPILVFVGLEITAQSFRATPPHHYPALTLAAMPLMASLAMIILKQVVYPLPSTGRAGDVVQTLLCLSNGFIVTSLLWGAALAELLDGQAARSAGYLLFAAACSLFGVIHSPLANEEIGWPWLIVGRIPEAAQFQTPYHWAAAYEIGRASCRERV